MSVQVFSRFTGANCNGAGEDPCTASFVSDQIAALERVLLVAQQGAHDFSSVNMSLGGGQNTSNCDTTQAARKAAIDNLRAEDIATAIASGNNGFRNAMSQPACISSAVSVGSTTDSDTVSSFSNIASFLSLLAPGSSIDSSVPGNGFANFNGTSMATPHVAGAWALLRDAHPSASVADLLSALQSTGTSVTDNRSGGTVTKPRINICDASEDMGTPPVAEDDSYSTVEGQELTVPAPGVLDNDTDADCGDTLEAVKVSDPSDGSLTLNADGSFTYEPDAGFTGEDTFTYKADDGNGEDTATVTITVEPKPCTITGTEGADYLAGTSGDDVICGLGGGDVIYDFSGGKDTFRGGAGVDILYSLGGGDDTLSGGEGNDYLIEYDGVSANDTLDGEAGTDFCYADQGDARLNCES